MDLTSFVMGRASAGGGGGTTPTQTKTATPTTSAQDVEPDSGYLLSKVTVAAIPSQYIIPTGTKAISENGTGIDVSQYAAVDVAVPSSGGSSYTLLHSEEIEDSYTSTTAGLIKQLEVTVPDYTGFFLLYVKVRDKAGPREGYFYGTDSWATYSTVSGQAGWKFRINTYSCDNTGVVRSNVDGYPPSYGIYPISTLELYHRKTSTSGTIKSTYVIEVYKLDYAPGGNPFS